MDKLYISDIPSEYHYAVISGDTVRLYNQPSAQGETIDCYILYPDVQVGLYSHTTQTFGNYNRQYFEDIAVSNEVWDRPDIGGIMCSVLTIAIFGVFLINLVTSLFKRGGILGGLL